MLYESLKILHIIGAAILLSSIGYSYSLWKRIESPHNEDAFSKIQKQTWLVIMPLAILQLASGFTIISVQQYDFSEIWISGSVISFILVIASWFGFIYFLLLSQQIKLSPSESTATFYRRAQRGALLICKFSLVIMIFFMTTKTTGWS
ncbi:MAG: DUF2269 family protein [Gammaproteobacteria bacterium]|nr:DUF2269 family protein [Gammaproteobacteria bacterium]